MSDSIRKMLAQDAIRRSVQPMLDDYSRLGSASEAFKAHQAIEEQEMQWRRNLFAPTLGDIANFNSHTQNLGMASSAANAYQMVMKEQIAPQKEQLANVLGVCQSTQIDELKRMTTNAAMHDWLDGGVKAKILGLASYEVGVQKFFELESQKQQKYEQLFRLPEVVEYARLASDSAIAGSLAASAFGALDSVGILQTKMMEMESPWVRANNQLVSVRAFADLQAIGYLIGQVNPLEAAISASLRADLGDWRDAVAFDKIQFSDPLLRSQHYLDHGFNPSLTNFTVPAFEQSIKIAGLRERDEADSPEVDSQFDEDGLARNRNAFDRIQRFEIRVRRFIEAVMLASFGEHWMNRQLPNDMLEKWQNKRETAIKAGEPNRSLIEYADFSDYRPIIERKDNWAKVFQPIFGRMEDVRESFQRLFPVRIATMHARIITLDDELFMRVEIKRILKAIHGRT